MWKQNVKGVTKKKKKKKKKKENDRKRKIFKNG